jgi:subtilisin family serine protease
MKKLLFLFIPLFVFSQQRDPRSDQFNFVTGELIVKLKDDVDAGVVYASVGQAPPTGKLVAKNSISKEVSRMIGLDAVVKSQEALFSKESVDNSIRLKQQKTLQRVQQQRQLQANSTGGSTSPAATKDEPEEFLSLKNVIKLELEDKNANILELVEKLKDNPNIEYIEPNYIYSIDDFEIVSDIIYDKDLSPVPSTSTSVTDDPLYSQQTNITQTNIDDVWNEYTTGDGSQIIAILDTGVDYTHPDLEANIWINEAELNGVEGYDDDGNGYIDDIRGWDFINIDNAPLDDNMHGTHVAGIAGAVGNNGIGIAGAAWDVKLMPIKVFQSTGQGNSTNIAAGVEYASNNGATIINMSFGSYAESTTLKLALENAYETSTLVASTGNEFIPIGPCYGCYPIFPAAYNYVLGVEDFTGTYDNFDQDGTTFTKYIELFNYELQAPGTGVMSTVPGGGYAPLTGTSMATPLVAGGVALYKQQKPEDSGELMTGTLINTSTPNIDFLAALTADVTPKLEVINFIFRDTINAQNGNSIIQPGETIEILPFVKNYWGPTEDVRVGIEFAEFEDQSKATIIQNEIQIGSISAYASLQDLYETLKITINDGVANNVDIKFNLTVWSGPNQDYISEPTEIVINVKSEILLFGLQYDDLTLSPQYSYLVPENLILMGNAVLTILPGTTLKFSDNVKLITQEASSIYAVGTKDNLINFQAENNFWSGFEALNGVFKFCKIKNINGYFFGLSSGGYFEDCEFTDFDVNSIQFGSSGSTSYNRVNFIDGIFSGNFSNLFNNQLINRYKNINIANINGRLGSDLALFTVYYSPYLLSSDDAQNAEANHPHGWTDLYFPTTSDLLDAPIDPYAPNWTFNIYGISRYVRSCCDNAGNYQFIPEKAKVFRQSYSVPGSVHKYLNMYLGSSDMNLIADYIDDATTMSNTSGIIDIDYIRTTPHEETHGIVWKVEVNGFDAQDEYALLDPLGVGTHEFKVYFNRVMDTSVNPQVSYGVTIPYNQKILSEQGTWSEDGKIYTVTHEINIGAADGINRIRVQDAQDLDYFKIPVEDSRFNFLLQSAGSASTGFFAAGGLGKIDLEWVAPSADELDDVLGYNMYRYQIDEDGNESEPEQLNETLIIEDTDESTTGVYFTDYDVVEGQTYFYKYKILRTSFEETDYSNTVSSAPLTSTLGDSNGDFDVNVLDLVHDVDYILGNNPKPFIFVAGDVNADNTINVLDIVGTVDIILNGGDGDSSSGSLDINFYPSEPIGYADFSWEGNDLYVESMHSIGGLQLAFEADFEYVLHDLPGVERLDYTQDESKVLMLYSFNNTAIASTRTKLLTSLDSTKEIDIDLAVAGTTTGAKLTPRFKGGELDGIDSPFQSNGLEFLKLFPNPSNGAITLEYYLPKNMDDSVAKVYDMVGRLVWIQAIEREEGMQQADLNLNSLQKGNYVVIISAGNNSGEQQISHKLLILK